MTGKWDPGAYPGHEREPAAPLPPLRRSGLVVSKADLVAALRAYVPNLVDVTPLDGERFLLSLAQAPPNEDRRT